MELELPQVISVDEDWAALTDLPARATKYCPYWLVLVHKETPAQPWWTSPASHCGTVNAPNGEHPRC